MTRNQQPALILFAVGLLGLGVLALIYGDFAAGYQPVAPWVPGRTALAYGSGVLMLALGVGLLFERTVVWSVRILLPYLTVWALLKVPALFVAPKMEAVWLGFGELTVLLAGGWTLFARLDGAPAGSALGFLGGDRGVRWAQILFGVSLLPIGLSHLFYTEITAGMVPGWIPGHTFFAYLTGVGHIAAGLGVLFGIFPRVAAWADSAMIFVFTLVLWGPLLVTEPKSRHNWTSFLISWVIASAAAAVAQNVVGKRGRGV